MNIFLSFSDAAKFADIARMLITTGKYGQSFTFWTNNLTYPFSSAWTGPLMPFSIALFFKIFGILDFAVVATSFFYFIILVLFTFLLGKKLFGKFVGVLSALAVVANIDFINYATTGATEPLFALEIVAAVYFVSFKKLWADILAFIMAVLMYFTRPQAFIYIAGLIFYWLLLKLKTKKASLLFGFVLVLGFLVDYFILLRFAGKDFIYSVTGRGLVSLTGVSAGGSASDALRGAIGQSAGGGLVQILKKVFYNLYNFYKLMPQIINPYLFVLFIVGLFKWTKDGDRNSFKAASIFMVVVTLLVATASIPFFRYIHPIVPLVYVIAVATLVWITEQISKSKKFIILTSTFLILIFGVGQTLGVMFLDSRFEANTHNIGKPPVYVVLSQILKENTNSSQIIITNLDTWGSWYGERKTVWFPLEPKQLTDSTIGKIPFDAIYLTSYLMDDQNYYMGTDWRLIFNNPTDSNKWTCNGCGEIAKEFILKGVYYVPGANDYEKQDARAVLLIRK